MPEVLEVAQLLEHHGVPQVQVGRGRVEAELDLERRGGPPGALELGPQLGVHDDLGGAPADAGELLIDGGLGIIHACIIAIHGGQTDAPNAPRSDVGAGSAGRSWPSLVLVLVTGLGVAASAFWVLTILPGSLPSVSQLERFDASEGTKVYDDNDELITEFHVERRIFVPLAQIPKALREAIIATEDARFYSHYGVDPMGIARAVYQNFRRGRIVEGGSTITQQLAKVLFLTPDKSLERKLKEAVLALELERRYSKDRIIEMYLNQIYFGHGAFGVEAAARTFFGKSVTELSLPEATLLAGLPKAPSTYSPFEHPEAAKRRRATVLARMVDVGSLPAPQAKKASDSSLGLIPPERRRTTGQHYLEYVQQQLEAQYGADLVFKGGMQVYTTLSPLMQVKAERSLREGLKALESRRVAAVKDKTVAPPERPEGALLTIDPQTGYIKAMVGGYDFFKSEFNRAVQARRQPGSAFKAFVYLAALESGQTPASVVDDSPIEFPAGRNGKPWKPENYDRKFRGPITYQQALEESVNVAAVKVLEKNGIRRTVDIARRLGVESPHGREPLGRAGNLRPHAARDHLRVRRAGQPGQLDTAHRHPLRARLAAEAARGEHPAEQAGGLARAGLRHDLHAAGHDRARHRRGGAGARAARRGQDRHHQRLLQRVVHRLHPAARHRSVGRLRPAAQPGQGRDGLTGRGADLDRLHAGGAGRDGRRRTSRFRSGWCWSRSTSMPAGAACGR